MRRLRSRCSRVPPWQRSPGSSGLQPPIATNDNRVLDSVWENGKLWFSANARCVPGGDVLIRTCGRVVELATATRTVNWETDLGVAGAHVFYPALRPDGDGNLVIVAGESGLKVLPEVIAFGRTPEGALTEPVVVAQSAGAYRGDRYGDYFGAARDPRDPRTVWVGGEAGTDVPAGNGWATAVASVVVTAAGATPPAVAGMPPPGVRALAAVVRAGSPVLLAVPRARRRRRDSHGRRRAEREAGCRLPGEHCAKDPSLRPALLHALAHEAGCDGTFTFCVNTVSTTGTAVAAELRAGHAFAEQLLQTRRVRRARRARRRGGNRRRPARRAARIRAAKASSGASRRRR